MTLGGTPSPLPRAQAGARVKRTSSVLRPRAIGERAPEALAHRVTLTRIDGEAR